MRPCPKIIPLCRPGLTWHRSHPLRCRQPSPAAAELHHSQPRGHQLERGRLSTNQRTDSLLLPFPRGCSAQPLLRSRTRWHPSTDLFASRDHPLRRQQLLLASPSSRICGAPAALLSLAKSPSPFSLPFTGCLNLHHKAAGSKHALERTNPWDVSWWVAEAESQAL